MAGASLLSLLDDITSILDDVALMTKTAAVKTSGVVGDDLAVNAEQVSGVAADRELPVVWAVAKGSFKNKCILIPAALLLSAFLPWLLTPLLMVGGTYLCFEGAEKIVGWLLHGKKTAEAMPEQDKAVPQSGCAQAPCGTLPKESMDAPVDGPMDEMLDKALDELLDEAAGKTPTANLDEATRRKMEQEKIQGAVRTDFVLSTEIIVVALGTIPVAAPFLEKTIILCIIGVVMTFGVYGVVGVIVKLDDMGLFLSRSGTEILQKLGLGMVRVVPSLMRSLTVVGTLAMFTVGGGILAHGLSFFHYVTDALAGWPAHGLFDVLAHAILGLGTGLFAFAGVHLVRKHLPGKHSA
ncbi:DUF808 domain-containing protein [Desulfovibrio sp. OttesenSCG-928-G15]|nr:DUF808 domain-containing protein [Desulfovibrio sp. OttesenSCG-928-G15]